MTVSNDQPFTPSAAGNGLMGQLHTYCSPLDSIRDGVLDDRIVNPLQQHLAEDLAVANTLYQLPPDLAAFAGRKVELETIMARLMPAAQPEQQIGRAHV